MRRTLLLALLLGSAALPQALTPPPVGLRPAGTARVPGHAQGAFDSLQNHFGSPRSGGLAHAPDGRTVYTLDATRVLWRWDAATGRALGSRVLSAPASLRTRNGEDIWQPALTLEGVAGKTLRLRAGGRANTSFSTRFTLELESGRTVIGDACPTSRTQIQVCTPGNTVRARFTGDAGRRTVTLTRGQTTGREVTLPGGGKPVALALSADGRHLAALLITPTQTWDEQGQARIHLVDVASGKLTRTLTVPGSTRPEEASLRWAGPDLLTALSMQNREQGGLLEGQTVTLWEARTGRVRWTLPPSLELRGAEPSPDGQSFVSVREASLPEIRRLTDARFMRALGRTLTEWTPLPGGRALVALNTGGGGGTLAVLDSGGGLRPVQGSSGASGAVAAARDGSALASAVAGRVRLHGASGTVRQTFEVPGFVQALAFSPDGKTLSAHVTAHRFGQGPGGEDPVQTLAWRVNTGRARVLPALPRGSTTALPVGETLWREDRRRPRQTGPGNVRLLALDLAGKVRWQTAWREDNVAWFPTPDGRALIQAQAIYFPQAERSGLSLERLDARTGNTGPALKLAPRSDDVYAALRVFAVAPDRRHVLLRESSGDGCGWGLLGVRLADLEARREVTLPPALASGLNRSTGCGYPAAIPEVAFAPDGGHLIVREGNAVHWWAGSFGPRP